MEPGRSETMSGEATAAGTSADGVVRRAFLSGTAEAGLSRKERSGAPPRSCARSEASISILDLGGHEQRAAGNPSLQCCSAMAHPPWPLIPTTSGSPISRSPICRPDLTGLPPCASLGSIVQPASQQARWLLPAGICEGTMHARSRLPGTRWRP
ncbi:hypothetical protein VTN96DRAFT_7359 [Rasamsonia emersonii]